MRKKGAGWWTGKAPCPVGRLVDLTEKALDVLDDTLDYQYDRRIKLRATIAILQFSGIGRALASKTNQQAGDQIAEAGD